MQEYAFKIQKQYEDTNKEQQKLLERQLEELNKTDKAPTGLKVMMGIQTGMMKKVVDNVQPNIKLNERNRLIYPDGTEVPLVVPISIEERRQLMKDIAADTKLQINKSVDDLVFKALDPFKKQQKKIENDVYTLKINIKEYTETELKNTHEKFSAEVKGLQNQLEETFGIW